MFYDVALIEKLTGKMISTWAGVERDLQHALVNLVFRSNGKIPRDAYLSLLRSVSGNEVDVVADKRYGYVVRSESAVTDF